MVEFGHYLYEVEDYLGNIGLERIVVATHEDGDSGSAIDTKGRGHFCERNHHGKWNLAKSNSE